LDGYLVIFAGGWFAWVLLLAAFDVRPLCDGLLLLHPELRPLNDIDNLAIIHSSRIFHGAIDYGNESTGSINIACSMPCRVF
jgi:hypothetical protein